MKGIITLCGSTKFKNEFNYVSYHLTLNDYIVLSVGAFMHSDNDVEIKDEIITHKEMLDRIHKEKIEMSRAIFVIDVNGYVGESTKSEIGHAMDLGLPIYYYSRGDLIKFARTTNLKVLNKPITLETNGD